MRWAPALSLGGVAIKPPRMVINTAAQKKPGNRRAFFDHEHSTHVVFGARKPFMQRARRSCLACADNLLLTFNGIPNHDRVDALTLCGRSVTNEVRERCRADFFKALEEHGRTYKGSMAIVSVSGVKHSGM